MGFTRIAASWGDHGGHLSFKLEEHGYVVGLGRGCTDPRLLDVVVSCVVGTDFPRLPPARLGPGVQDTREGLDSLSPAQT